MKDSDNNKVWHRVVDSQKQMAPSVANSPIRSGLNLASTHQMTPPSTHLIKALLHMYSLQSLHYAEHACSTGWQPQHLHHLQYKQQRMVLLTWRATVALVDLSCDSTFLIHVSK